MPRQCVKNQAPRRTRVRACKNGRKKVGRKGGDIIPTPTHPQTRCQHERWPMQEEENVKPTGGTQWSVGEPPARARSKHTPCAASHASTTQAQPAVTPRLAHLVKRKWRGPRGRVRVAHGALLPAPRHHPAPRREELDGLDEPPTQVRRVDVERRGEEGEEEGEDVVGDGRGYVEELLRKRGAQGASSVQARPAGRGAGRPRTFTECEWPSHEK